MRIASLTLSVIRCEKIVELISQLGIQLKRPLSAENRFQNPSLKNLTVAYEYLDYGVARELLSLQTVLEFIQEDVTDESKSFPTTLERHVSVIIINCNSVVVELQECITKYGGDSRLKSKTGWAINGQGDVAKLRSNLEAHKAALELALDMHVTKEIKNDTSEIRNETSAIKDDTAQILEEIFRLQQRLPKQGGNDYILQNFLEEMTTYTEKALGGASIDAGGSSTKAPSFVLETDEGSHRPSDAAYLSDWELDSAASDPVSYKLKMNRWKEQKREERLAETKLKDVQRSLESPQPQPIAFHRSDHQEPSDEDEELGPVPPESAYIEDWEKSSVESETEWWKKKEKEWHDRKHQLDSGQLQRLPTSGQFTSSREDTKGTTGIHLHGVTVPEENQSQSSPTDPGDVARKRHFKPGPLNHDSDNEYSHDSEKLKGEGTNDISRNAIKSNRLTPSASAVAPGTQDSYYVEVETFYGRLVINRPMPTAITDLLSEDYYTESSCNSFTAVMCTAQGFLSQKDTLRPKRFPKPRDIKVVFYIPVTTKTTSSCFKRQWEFITTAVAGLTRRLELGDDVPPPWHNIVIVVEGPPRWDNIHPEIEFILTELGILYRTDNLVTKVDGVVLDPPYHKDHCEVFGRRIFGTIQEVR
ncbi:hypothetical protein FCIRC_7597 [Fusarium circinatum]|uniref:Uncharacterized protein n=1 Tax=Fusarium circinatum TaxID=48490 RepID=A0A8H5WYY6_FUSCI|nr:hypothetical protein FCIRC_7597 [Fusarium circinatum]